VSPGKAERRLLADIAESQLLKLGAYVYFLSMEQT